MGSRTEDKAPGYVLADSPSQNTPGQSESEKQSSLTDMFDLE